MTDALHYNEFIHSGAFVSWDQDHWLVGWGSYEWLEEPDGEGCFYAPDFFLETSRPWLKFKNTQLVSKSEISNLLIEGDKKPRIMWLGPEKMEFFHQFELVKKHFQMGSLSKAVPVVFSKAHKKMGEVERLHVLRQLLKIEDVHAYGFWTEEEGLLGATPEILLDLEGRELFTMALAGTAALSQGDLLHDEKECYEHQLVVDDLNKQLTQWGPVNQQSTYEWKLKNLKHLRTDLSVKIEKEVSFHQMVKHLHPTPALGVAPRNYNWKFLKSLSGERMRFGAPFGVYFKEGKTRLFVAIRNMQWKKDRCLIGAGCGVVEQSVADKEWQELQLKKDSVRDLLDL